jgi:surface protein
MFELNHKKNKWMLTKFMKYKKSISILIGSIVVVSLLVGGVILLFSSKNDANFISVWDTTKISPNSSFDNQIELPLISDGTYNFSVEWGDGTSDRITTWNQLETTHTYASQNNYTINIKGMIVGWSFVNTGDKLKLFEIKQWGVLQLGNSGKNFYGCSNLKITASDILNLTNTTSLESTFRGCSSIDEIEKINEWDVSSVTDMSYMFAYASCFNQNIGNWDVSSVTNMRAMFRHAYCFNQNIGNWDVSSVTDMRYMFVFALIFNRSIDNWDVSSVTDMGFMFFVTSFNQNISNWDVSSVTNMGSMFSISLFNQNIGNWDVSSVINMYGMFYNASFNQNINNWNVSSVADMSYMFRNAYCFNQNIGNWDVSSVADMHGMFSLASSFNQNIGDWDVSSVTDMRYMFRNASSFNQNISDWDVSSVYNMGEMFLGISLSTTNYDDLLIGWNQLTLQNGVNFDGGYSKYSSGSAADARQSIIDNYGWSINDGGQI